MLRKLSVLLLVLATISLAGSTMLSRDFSYSVPCYSVRLTNIGPGDARYLEEQGYLIEWIHGDRAALYVNAEQEDLLRYQGYDPIPIIYPEPLVPYPSITEIYASIDAVVAAHPGICRLENIGTSVQGRDILAVVVSDNVSTEEVEPEMRMHGAIHGDEKASAMTTLNYLEVLTDNYATSSMCQYIVDNTESWIIPVLNPDGYNSTTRVNANGIDLNRNCSYMGPGGGGGSTAFSEPETAALRDLTMQNWPDIENFINPFTAGLSLHGGAECINTVWNYTGDPLPEDYDLLDAQCNAYVNDPGILNYFGAGVFWIALPGYSWYQTNGDVNDWSYGECGTIDHTIEVDDNKLASDWPGIANAHYMATLEFFTSSTYGIWGTVTDGSGDPIDAHLAIGISDGLDSEPLRFCRTDVTLGDYHKSLIPGTYNVEVTADGYTSQVVTDVAVGSQERVEVSFVLYLAGIEGDPEAGYGEFGHLNIFPNPSFGSVSFDLPETGVEGYVTIYDITGRSLLKQGTEPGDGSFIWNCTDTEGSRVPSGLYIVKFLSGDHSWNSRFVVNR